MKEIKTEPDIESLRVSGARPELVALVARRLQEMQAAYDDLEAVYDPDADGQGSVDADG